MLACASLWSIAGIFIKLIDWSPLVIAGFRSIIAAAVMVAYMCFKKKKIIFNRSSIMSGIMLCLTFLLFVTANKLTTSANAIVLQFTAPIFILLLSALFLHQRFHTADVITVVVTLLGISLFFFDKLSSGSLLGSCVAIFAGFSMACMYICTGRSDETSRMSGILIGHLLTAIVGIPFAFILPTPISTKAVLSILVLGIFQLGIPYVLYGIAVANCTPLSCSLIGAIEPLLNPLWVFIFSREVPGPWALVGGIIVILTITIWCVRNDRIIQKSNKLNTVSKYSPDI